MNAKEIRVGIADLNIATSPDKLITVGLGSCVGIALMDSVKNIGGLAHIMLPDSTQFNKITNNHKFADLAIPELVDTMIRRGASKRNIKAKIAGGASMFNFSDKSLVMDIGNRNVIAVKECLSKLSIPVISEDVRGNKGRTMIFDVGQEKVYIRTVGLEPKEI